jgi:lipopolysaccharide export system ATP-binding protein
MTMKDRSSLERTPLASSTRNGSAPANGSASLNGVSLDGATVNGATVNGTSAKAGGYATKGPPVEVPIEGPQMISARGLCKKYGERTVVDSVNFEVLRGEVVGLLGPNGAGKTTSFYMIMGLVRPDGGQVLLDKLDVTQWPMYRRARHGIGYLAQDPSVFRQLSVEDNIRAILEMMPLTRLEQEARCEELLHDLDLTERRRELGVKLSGGERRRTEIARSLATDPAFILLDEPFTGVDPINREEIQEIVRRLRARGIGILITDHNESATLDIVDRAYIVYNGRIEAHGTPRELLVNNRARELYFGDSFGRNGATGG